MSSAGYYNPYTPYRAPSAYATHSWAPPQMGPSTSQQVRYPIWNPGYDTRSHPHDLNQLAQDERVALELQEQLDIAQAIANSQHTAERETTRLRRDRDPSDKRQTTHHAPPLRPSYSSSSGSSARSRHSRAVPDTAQLPPNTSFRARRYIRRPDASPAEKLLEYDTTFTADFRCPRCAELIVTHHVRRQRYSPSVISSLHLRCPGCSTTYCRGCALRTNCPPGCDGGKECPLTKCCQTVSAVAIFEALSNVDQAYAVDAAELTGSSPPSLSQREDFLELVVSRADTRVSNAFDRVLLDTLREINRWMPEKPSRAGGDHPAIGLLFSSSYILEIIQQYLSQPRPGDWIIRLDICLESLILINMLASRHRLAHLVMQPRNIKDACGLHNIIWRKGKILCEDGPDGVTDSLYKTVMSPTGDRAVVLEKLQKSLQSPELQGKAWLVLKKVHRLSVVSVAGPDYQ